MKGLVSAEGSSPGLAAVVVFKIARCPAWAVCSLPLFNQDSTAFQCGEVFPHFTVLILEGLTNCLPSFSREGGNMMSAQARHMLLSCLVVIV